MTIKQTGCWPPDLSRTLFVSWLDNHDDVIKWKYFPRYWPLCGEFTGHRWIPLTKASGAELWFFLISAWINGWVNNREVGDMKRHRTNYDVTVIWYLCHMMWLICQHSNSRVDIAIADGLVLIWHQDIYIHPGDVVRSTYRQVSNIKRILVGNNIVDHSDVFGASPVGAAPSTSSFST